MTFLPCPSACLTLHYANHSPNEAKVMLRKPRLTCIDYPLIIRFQKRLEVRAGGCHLVKVLT